MKLFVFGLAACLAVGLSGFSARIRADEPAKQEKSDPAKELATLEKEFNEAQQAFYQALQGAKTPEERQQVFKEKQPKPAEYAERFSKLAEKYPDRPEATMALAWIVGHARGTDAANKALVKVKEKVAAIEDLDQLNKVLQKLQPPFAFMDLAAPSAEKAKKNLDNPQAVPVLIWVCSATLYSGGTPLAKLYDSTVDLLMERFPERKELAPLGNWLAQDSNPEWAEKHLRKLVEKNSDEMTQMSAKFGLASILKNKDEASQPEAEKLFQSIVEEKNHLSPQATEELSDMKVRGLGKPVPEINGEDLDSKLFKLSDYKGKVVLLDFWAFW